MDPNKRNIKVVDKIYASIFNTTAVINETVAVATPARSASAPAPAASATATWNKSAGTPTTSTTTSGTGSVVTIATSEYHEMESKVLQLGEVTNEIKQLKKRQQ